MSAATEPQKRRLVYAAGLLYTLSLHKYVSRDPLAQGAGLQGMLEFGLMGTALALTFVAARGTMRRYAPSPAYLCFVAFGLFALASSWRSYNPPLSAVKGILLFVVLGIGYLASQMGLAVRLFQSIYWSYTASLAVGLLLGLVDSSRFPLWSVDEFTGRARLSVFGTFPGTMGETAAYLILLSPLLFRRTHWISRLFLLLINLAAGGKTSTALLLLLLAIEYLSQLRTSRSWRSAILVGSACAVVLVVLALTFTGSMGIEDRLAQSMGMIYGHDVSGEAVSLDGRLDLWRGAVNLIVQSPVLGYGFDGAREILLSIAAWSGSSHNGFLELGLAGGALALAAFVLGCLGVVRACWQAAPELRFPSLLVLAYMLPVALTGVTFNFPSYFGLLILVLLLFLSRSPIAARP